jgi:hypothetical protein
MSKPVLSRSLAPDRFPHTARSWARANARPAAPRGVVTDVLRKTLTLDYSPQEWVADLLSIAEQVVESFADVSSDHPLTFEYDEEAEFTGPHYFRPKRNVTEGFRVVTLTPRKPVLGSRRLPYGVLASVRKETDPFLADPNLEDLMPADLLTSLRHSSAPIYSVSLHGRIPDLGFTSPRRRGGFTSPRRRGDWRRLDVEFAVPPPGRYDGKLPAGLRDNHPMDLTVSVREATPVLPETAAAFVNIIDAIPILIGRLVAKL